MYKLVESRIFCVTLSSSNIDMAFVDCEENEERLQQNGSHKQLKLSYKSQNLPKLSVEHAVL
jgi:hypothetical protein